MENNFVIIEDLQFDEKKYQDLIDVIENYAVGSMLIGGAVSCKVYQSVDNCSMLRYSRRNEVGYTNLEIILPKDDTDHCKYKFIISFYDDKFDPSGFKGVFNREKYKYRLKRSDGYFDYEITTNIEKHIEQIQRLMKLFRKYL